MPSKIWSISSELYFAVPLNSRCSSRWESPACSSVSALEPAPIQNPSDTDRTEGIASVTIRTPESSVVSRCSAATAGLGPGALRVAVAHPATGVPRRAAIPVAVAVAPAAASLAATIAAIAAVAPRRPGVSGAHGAELLDALAGDVGVAGQAQADAAPLAVDLDHP